MMRAMLRLYWRANSGAVLMAWAIWLALPAGLWPLHDLALPGMVLQAAEPLSEWLVTATVGSALAHAAMGRRFGDDARSYLWTLPVARWQFALVRLATVGTFASLPVLGFGGAVTVLAWGMPLPVPLTWNLGAVLPRMLAVTWLQLSLMLGVPVSRRISVVLLFTAMLLLFALTVFAMRGEPTLALLDTLVRSALQRSGLAEYAQPWRLIEVAP